MTQPKPKPLGYLGFAIPHSLVALVVGGGFPLGLDEEHISVSNQINVSVMLPLKAGVIGVITAALLAFWGYFWVEVIQTADVDDLPSIVRSYRRSFAYLVPAILLLFVSMGADFYLALFDPKNPTAGDISFGTFAASFLMLLGFVITFALRTLNEMDTLRRAGESRDSTAGRVKQKERNA